MILQKKLVDRPYSLVTITKEKPATQSLTIPGQGFNLRLAMEQYKRGTLVERVKAFYEVEGMVSPDFNRMDRIEKLEALAGYRQLMKEKKERLIQNNSLAKKKENDQMAKLQKEKSFGGKAPKGDPEPPNAN